MPRVLNLHRDEISKNSLYIGRGVSGQPSILGNPYVIGQHGPREFVIPAYERDLKKDDEKIAFIMREVRDRGRDVVCFCAPKMCHGDIIIRIAAMSEAELAAWRANPNDLLYPFPEPTTEEPTAATATQGSLFGNTSPPARHGFSRETQKR